MHLDAAHRLAIRALVAGAARKHLTTVEWNAAGTCERPVYREISVRPGAKQMFPTDDREKSIIIKPGTQARMTVELWVTCRKCDDCRDRRRALWSARARCEVALSQRTWLCTLTLRPESHFAAEVAATRRLRAGGTRFDALDNVEQFRELHAEHSSEITRWIKRVRKNSGAKLRLICVCEAHKSGKHHYHLLVHEVAGTVTYRDLATSWHWGFGKWNVIDRENSRAVGYVTKYLSKSALARVRASARYGQGIFGLGRRSLGNEVESRLSGFEETNKRLTNEKIIRTAQEVRHGL